MEKEINIPEIPECRFFIQGEIFINNLAGIEIGMINKNGVKCGNKIPNKWESENYGKIDFSTLTDRERIIGGIFASIQSEMVGDN